MKCHECVSATGSSEVNSCKGPVLIKLGQISIPWCRERAAQKFEENPYYFAGLEVVEVDPVQAGDVVIDLTISHVIDLSFEEWHQSEAFQRAVAPPRIA